MSAFIFGLGLGFFVGVAAALVMGVLIASSDYSKREEQDRLERLRERDR